MNISNNIEVNTELTVTSQIAESKSGLALNLKTGALHERYQTGDELRFGLSELLPVAGCGKYYFPRRVGI